MPLEKQTRTAFSTKSTMISFKTVKQCWIMREKVCLKPRVEKISNLIRYLFSLNIYFRYPPVTFFRLCWQSIVIFVTNLLMKMLSFYLIRSRGQFYRTFSPSFTQVINVTKFKFFPQFLTSFFGCLFEHCNSISSLGRNVSIKTVDTDITFL